MVPSSDQELQARAFLVLAHSAIEELLENSVRLAVEDCFQTCDVAIPLIALPLIAKYAGDICGQHGGRIPAPEKIANMLPGLFYTKVIKPNNGIRKKSIVRICAPLGINIAEFGDVCDSALGELDTLGAKRGASAHTLRGAAHETIHPDQAREWVTKAVDALEMLLPLILQEIEKRTFGEPVTDLTGVTNSSGEENVLTIAEDADSDLSL